MVTLYSDWVVTKRRFFMKLVNFLIIFILTLSLSANISCKGYELADNINLLKNLKYDENVESLNCSNESCIDLSDNDYVEVFFR